MKQMITQTREYIIVILKAVQKTVPDAEKYSGNMPEEIFP